MGTLSSELAPHAEKLTARPRIYADANVPAGIVAHMGPKTNRSIVVSLLRHTISVFEANREVRRIQKFSTGGHHFETPVSDFWISQGKFRRHAHHVSQQVPRLIGPTRTNALRTLP